MNPAGFKAAWTSSGAMLRLRLREREVNEGYREGFEREFERDEMEKKLKLAVFAGGFVFLVSEVMLQWKRVGYK